ncbi:MAG: tRNA (N(6)-L-threonylcarbamoyladenosine(37)-C(2))-methylthiotransferase MtaB [Chloroflexi bacterium]|nr:MAG: tRNA (N(6)-L-threonylcarbamoyladenosine(37)-C(2))-methylthiotransferase MtaB [Chloroflexota bacterium]
MQDHSLSESNTYAVATLGCKVNQADSEAISEQMSTAGFVQRDFSDAADVYIVNTCTVTHLGDRSSRQLISQARRRQPDALLVVTGCYAELNPTAVAALPGVDLVVGNSGKSSLVEAVKERWKADSSRHSAEQISSSENQYPQQRHMLPVLPLDTHHIGSDQSLLIDGEPCIVPYVRGGSRSRSIASVVDHVQRKERAGYQEIVLTGIHLGDYHPDENKEQDLGHLIAALLQETTIPRIRVSSLEPEDFRLEWLELWQNSRMCRHFHLPMQSGSDTILRRMARRYNSARYHTLVTTARRLIPGVAISTDIITGFPGESESDFEQTFQLASELQFAKSHVFRFSPRQGTAAARMRGQIKDEVKKARSEQLLALNDEHSRLFRQQFLGSTVQVLLEDRKHGRWEGLTDNYLRVEIVDLPESETRDWQNTLVNAHLSHLAEDGIAGFLAQ